MDKFQFRRANRFAAWSAGSLVFDNVWTAAQDHLRFHEGANFSIRKRARGAKWGPKLKLSEVEAHLKPLVKAAPHGTVFSVRSLKDGYTLQFRWYHRTTPPTSPLKGPLVIAHAAKLKGTPYSLGGCDCSWLSMVCCEAAGAKPMPHNAHEQRISSQVVSIPKSKIKPGDLLFIHNDAHVAIYLDDRYSIWQRIFRRGAARGRVWDTEPRDAPAPWGGWLHRGVQVRPMESGWYCAWENVNAIGRIIAINGPP